MDLWAGAVGERVGLVTKSCNLRWSPKVATCVAAGLHKVKLCVLEEFWERHETSKNSGEDGLPIAPTRSQRLRSVRRMEQEYRTAVTTTRPSVVLCCDGSEPGIEMKWNRDEVAVTEYGM